MKLLGLLSGGEVFLRKNDGARLPEHQITYYQGSSTSAPGAECFVESENGEVHPTPLSPRGRADEKEFEICLRKPTTWDGQDLQCIVCVDGRAVKGTSIRRERGSRSWKYHEDAEGERVVKTRLKFDEMQPDDVKSASMDGGILAALGAIVIIICEGTFTSHPAGEGSGEATGEGLDTMSGKGKSKAAGRIVSFRPLREPWNIEYQILLKYRSREVLESRNLIDKSPRPVSVPAPTAAPPGRRPSITVDIPTDPPPPVTAPSQPETSPKSATKTLSLSSGDIEKDPRMLKFRELQNAMRILQTEIGVLPQGVLPRRSADAPPEGDQPAKRARTGEVGVEVDPSPPELNLEDLIDLS